MLLKLIKYDFKEQLREHIGLYALVFVSARACEKISVN